MSLGRAVVADCEVAADVFLILPAVIRWFLRRDNNRQFNIDDYIEINHSKLIYHSIGKGCDAEFP
jgi:hypothetical protein